jgi:hypothetical protein
MNRAAMNIFRGREIFMRLFQEVPLVDLCCSPASRMKMYALTGVAEAMRPGYRRDPDWQHPPHPEHAAYAGDNRLDPEVVLFLLGSSWQQRDDDKPFSLSQMQRAAWALAQESERLLAWYYAFFEQPPIPEEFCLP